MRISFSRGTGLTSNSRKRSTISKILLNFIQEALTDQIQRTTQNITLNGSLGTNLMISFMVKVRMDNQESPIIKILALSGGGYGKRKLSMTTPCLLNIKIKLQIKLRLMKCSQCNTTRVKLSLQLLTMISMINQVELKCHF